MQKWNLGEKLGKENLDCKIQPWRKSTVNRKVKVNGQLPMMTSAILRNLMTSTRWRHLMTSVMADVDADVAVMTLAMMSTSDLAAHAACEHVVQSSPKLLLARDGMWGVRLCRFFSSDVDQSKSIPMTAAVRWSEQYWRRVRCVEKLLNLWPARGWSDEDDSSGFV